MDTSKEKQSLEERVSLLEAQVAQLQQEVALMKAAESEFVSLSGLEIETPIEKTSETSPITETISATGVVEPTPTSIPEESTEAGNAMVDIECEEVSTLTESTAEAQPVVDATVTDRTVSRPMGRMQPAVRLGHTKPQEPEEEDVKFSFWKDTESSPAGSKSWEDKIGKMLLPLAGSVLIIFALVLFGSLIQPRLTDGMKAILMTLVSVAMAGVGTWKMQDEGRFRNLFAALAGCGSASLYITLLVSHFALDVLPEMGLMVGAVVWIAAMTTLSKYRSRMFCYICYIGILIAAYMTVQRWGGSPVGLIVYMVSVGALFATNCTRHFKQDWWLLWQYPLVMMPMYDTYDGSTVARLLIFGSTAAVLVGQIHYYHKQVENSKLWAVPTLLTLIVLIWSATQVTADQFVNVIGLEALHGTSPLDNAPLWSLLLAATLGGLTWFYHKIYKENQTKDWKGLYIVMAAVTALLIPCLNFGALYHGWCGTCWVPALLALGYGCLKDQKVARYVGYAYLFFYTWGYGANMALPQKESEYFTYNLQVGALVYLATLIGFGIAQWRRSALAEKVILLTALVWGIFQLYLGHWVDSAITYLALCALNFALIFKPLRSSTEGKIDKASLTQHFLGIGLAMLSVLVRLQPHEHTYFMLQLHAFKGPLIGLVAVAMLWIGSYRRGARKGRIMAYILLALHLFCSPWHNSDAEFLAIWGIYLAGALALTYWVWRHYNQTDKIGLAALALCFIWALNIGFLLGSIESWALSALFVIVCGMTRFTIDPRTGTVEPSTHKLCLAAHEILLLIGTFLLREAPVPLSLNHYIEGTEPYATAFLVVFVLLLALINLRRVNALMRHLPEYGVSIYNGLKFTWTLAVILWRFSTVSYLMSLAGILLAIVLIVAGFKYRYKGLRLYGLVLTMVCVVKLLFFDIVFDNAFYRPLSFLVAGFLLFLISFIYFRLEKNKGSHPEK